MNAMVTGIRSLASPAGTARVSFDILFWGAPLPDSMSRSSFITLAVNDTTTSLSAKLSAAVDAEGQLVSAEFGNAVTPTVTFAPAYIKLK